MPIVRNSFIQISKLPNLKGRISYISSKATQENLYAVYETTDRKFWTELARCNQEEFKKSGTEGTCIEARELIIALPESFVDYELDKLLKLFSEHFKQSYGVECISALHHNKRKTNYHIHLIFSERKLLDEPVEKIATRNMFYDEVKRSYTDLINIYVKDDKQKLKVFDRNGVYLPTKKIGKNNPKAEQIRTDNQYRAMWNQTVDRALISGVPERQILEVKQSEIRQKVKASIQKLGRNPALLKSLIMTAIYALELLIGKVFKKADKGIEMVAKAETEQTPVKKVNTFAKAQNEPLPEMPKKSVLVSKFNRLEGIYQKLDEQNKAIYEREQQLIALGQKLSEMKGMFKGKERKQLQEQMEQLQSQIENMKRYLPTIVQGYGYKNVKEFLAEYKASKAEYGDYRKAVAEWEKLTGEKVDDSFKAKLQQKQQKAKEQNGHINHHKKNDRGAR